MSRVCLKAFTYLPNALDNTTDDAAAIQHSVPRVRITRYYYYVYLFKRRVNRFKTRREKRIFHCMFPREFTRERVHARNRGGGANAQKTILSRRLSVSGGFPAAFSTLFAAGWFGVYLLPSSTKRGGKMVGETCASIQGVLERSRVTYLNLQMRPED